MFRPDERVEVKAGRGLGTWLPATVIGVVAGCCGKGVRYDLQLERGGHQLMGIAARFVRRPREAPPKAPTAQKPKAKRPKSRPRTDREPLRFPDYVAWVREQHVCMFCSRKAEEAHHHGKKGMGQKVDDLRVVPLCKTAHDAIHAHRLDRMCSPHLVLATGVSLDVAWSLLHGNIARRQVELICEWVREGGSFR
jgi:hypothetical protein